MAFVPKMLTSFTTGVVLVGDSSDIPATALRVGRNIRLDRVLTAISSRPGSSVKTAAPLAGVPLHISKLFGLLADYSYAHYGTSLVRLNDAWDIVPGPDLVTNGSFTGSAAGWTLGANWTYAGNAVVRAAAAVTTLLQALSIIAGARYAVTYTLSAYTAGTLTVSLGGATGTARSALGTYTDYLVTTSTAPLVFTPNAAGAFTLDTVSVKLDSFQVLAAAVGTTPLTDATMPDGEATPVPYKYFTGAGGPLGKDNGTTFSPWGIAPPTAAPLSLALATDLSTLINACDATTNWTVVNTSAIATDANIKVEGANSLTYTIAPSTLGSVTLYPLPSANLDTLAGGDATVKSDDYIHLWLRLDRPDRLDFMQIDIDIDADTTSAADAFRDNFYSAIVSTADLSGGADQWSELQIRKSAFQRYGTDAARSWATAVAFRLRVLTNSLGILTLYQDDIKLRGGIGLEGAIDYTCYYKNSTTKARGNPPKNSDGAVLWTAPLTTNRQRITVTTTNVIQGGAAHPGDAQIDTLCLVRRDVEFPDGVLVAEIADTTASPYLDTTSDATLLLSPIALEDDNDMPPTGATVVFGPGATNRLFLIEHGYRLRYSKQWERLENRVENWPLANDAGIGDGSQLALAGLCLDTQVFVWTEAATFQCIGSGDNFLPTMIPNSRGIVGTKAVTAGDGRLFFVSQDGIYEQVGVQQRKITLSIDPFFLGMPVDGNPAMHTSATIRRETRLLFYPDALNPMLVMLYADTTSSGALNRRLVLKRSQSVSQLTSQYIYQFQDCFFDDHTGVAMRALFLDTEDNQLLAGGSDSQIWQLEDHTMQTDAGASFVMQARTQSDHNGDQRSQKRYSQVVVEGQTHGQTVTPTIYYDKNTLTEAPGGFASTSIATQTLLPILDATVRRRDIALDLVATVTDQIILSAIGWYAAPVGGELTFWDSDTLTSPTQQRVDRLQWELDAPAPLTLTLLVDGVAVDTGTVPATAGRQRVTYVLAHEVRGRAFRVTLRSATGFDMYTEAAQVFQWANPAILGPFWDSGPIEYPLITHWKWVEYDVSSTTPVTFRVSVEQVVRQTLTLPTTQGARVKGRLILAPHWWGRLWRVTMEATAEVALYGVTAWGKARGDAISYQPKALVPLVAA